MSSRDTGSVGSGSAVVGLAGDGQPPVRVKAGAPWRTAAGIAAATLAVVVLDPQHRHVPLCPFHAATGWWCPLCGGLRATNALAHGHWLAALHDNVVFVASIPVLVWLWLDWLRRTHRGLGPRPLGRSASIAVVVGLVAFTIVRNLPGMSALRP